MHIPQGTSVSYQGSLSKFPKCLRYFRSNSWPVVLRGRLIQKSIRVVIQRRHQLPYRPPSLGLGPKAQLW